MKNEISSARLEKLNHGEIETQNLTDGLSINFSTLLHRIYPQLSKVIIPQELGIKTRMQKAAETIFNNLDQDNVEQLKTHRSDTARGWACFIIALTIQDIASALEAIKPLANDPHFGVREWAWIALRPTIRLDIKQSIKLLKTWVFDSQPNIRRFAIEITRPRSVWGTHIEALKDEPWLGLDLLEPLKSEPIKYVQDSVANWLNDAAKSKPSWVRELCENWQNSSQSKETIRICKHAQRSIK